MTSDKLSMDCVASLWSTRTTVSVSADVIILGAVTEKKSNADCVSAFGVPCATASVSPPSSFNK